MSNNIYDILKKMQNLEAPKQSLTESKKSKPDYIDIDRDGDKKEPMKKAAQEKSKGAVAEAVAQVEQQLAEKYQGFKKSVAEGVQAKGVIKPTDSGDEYTPAPGYRVKAEFEPSQTKPKMGFVKSDSEQTGQAAKPAKPAETPKVDEDALDFLRSPEGISKNRADQARADQNFADRSAKHFAGQIGDQYHDQLMKNSPSYADEYRSRAKDMPYDKLDKLSKSLQAKHDPMGGPTNIDYEKIKKNPMSTRAGEEGADWRPFGPGPKDSFDSDKFGRPVREGDMDESALQAYLGKKKYGREGMQALQQAGRDGASKEKMAQIRARHDKMDEGEAEQDPYGQYRKKIKPGNTVGSKIAAGAKNMKRKAEKFVANTMGHNLERGPLDEQNYTEDMLSPKQKKIASMAGDPDKIDAKDFAALRGEKKGKKDEGNAFSGALDAARDAGKGEFKVGGKEYKVQEDDGDFTGDMDDRGNLQLSPTGAAKVQKHSNYDPKLSANAQYSKHFDDRGNQRMTHDQAVEVGNNPKYNPNLPANAQWDLLNKSGNMRAMKEGQDGPEYQTAWKRTQDERKAWEKSNPDKKYYDQGPAERHSMELSKARDTDRAAKDEKRGPLGRVANTLSRGLFGQELPEGRTSMREGWEEMQKYLEKKRGPESKGDAGKKAGTRYGGSAQRDDDDEEMDGEGKPAVKKKGRPKGTGGGAKFNFKKPKD